MSISPTTLWRTRAIGGRRWPMAIFLRRDRSGRATLFSSDAFPRLAEFSIDTPSVLDILARVLSLGTPSWPRCVSENEGRTYTVEIYSSMKRQSSRMTGAPEPMLRRRVSFRVAYHPSEFAPGARHRRAAYPLNRIPIFNKSTIPGRH